MENVKTNLENPRMVENIHVYTLSNLALNIYREEAKTSKNLEKDILERKLTAMILASRGTAKEFFDSFIAKFMGFNMIVNTKSKKIEVIYWDTQQHKVTNRDKELLNRLKETYKLLGLSGTGNTLLSEA